jgi:hypothetical protein
MSRFPRLSNATLCWYLALLVIAQAWPPVKAPAPVQGAPSHQAMALGLLATSDAFYSGAIGYAGTPSVQALAWNTLLQLPQADSLFRELFRVGNPPGQLYALAGLYYVDSAGFERSAAQLAGRRDQVEVMEGCVRVHRPLAELLAEVASGRWSGMLRTIRTFPQQMGP